MRILGVNNTINFQRRPTKREESELKKTVTQAYDLIGAKERAVITHGSCFPALNRDSYIGSPYGNAAKEYIKFLSLYGFNSNQLGPGGELEKGSTSPYNSSAFAQNRLFIDLEECTKENYGNLLSAKTYKRITTEPKITDKNYTMTDFNKASKAYNIGLTEIYNNFKKNVSDKQPQALKLNKEYNKFLEKNDERLTEEGIFRVLSDKYKTDDYTLWDDKLDRTLISDIRNGDMDAEIRFNNLYTNNAHRVEQYKFEQFLISKQIKEHKEWRDENNFKYINDLLVGCSKMDAWRYEEVFLDDWEMGAFEGNSISQRWHIPVIDPKKLFLNDKYELNTGGKFLKEKIDAALEFCENIRVDHVLGLVEPYLMSKYAKDEDFITNPTYLKNKNKEKYISELKDPYNSELEYDLFWDYPKLIEHLVLPAFKEHGIDKNLAVWEDLCSYPDRFKQIYEEQKLPKITSLDWTRAEAVLDSQPDNWFMMGSHDSMPAMRYLRRKAKLNNGETFEYTRKQEAWNTNYLAGYLNQDNTRENIAETRNNLSKLYDNNDNAIVFAKFAELLTTPKFQISFDDLLGITDIIYNVPGTANKTNWRARITSDYIDKYYKNLSGDNPTALNIPELLAQALQAKIDKEVKSHNYDDTFKVEIYKKCQPVLDKLKYYAEILKE